jgi:lysophospholipase L1-like esterase
MRFARTSLALALGLTAVLLPATPAAADPGPPPSSIASMGDSITRGFNTSGWYSDNTARSFSTGTDTGVNSHYRRILAKNPAISGRTYNVGETGADSFDMPAQATAAVGRGVDYVVMLIGANDACTSSEGSMTPVTTFRTNINTALSTLKAGLPNARVAVVSIPDIKRLWFVGKGSGSARFFWNLGGICQSMLANPTSTSVTDEARRDRVRQRVVDFNAQLAQACAAYGPNCDFDGNAVFGYQFQLSHLSTWDYFHPNTTGQQILANVSYAAGFNW